MTIAPLDVSPEQWRIVRDILRKHVRGHEVWAFGSRARRTARRYSDLDLAIITDQPLSFEVTGAMAEDFSESDLPFRVDILDWSTTEQNFRRIIEAGKIIVQPPQVIRTTKDGSPPNLL
jgi:predicted nucleotidyltransferase